MRKSNVRGFLKESLLPADKQVDMNVSSIATEVLFFAGWIAVGAAALYSRYKKALELREAAHGVKPEGAAREYHKGLYFGRAVLSEATASEPEWKAPEEPEVSGIDAEAIAPASLARLAHALEDAQPKVQPAEEKTPAA
jgi:hypothetical protein